MSGKDIRINNSKLTKHFSFVKFGNMHVRVRDDPDYETKVGGVVPDPAIFISAKSSNYTRTLP